MAKRRRLTPAQPDFVDGRAVAPRPALAGPAAISPAPIAQVAGEASARAALDELTGVMETARARGLMITLLPVGQIDDGHLVRDRLVQDEEEMSALMLSIRARGQQTPIEVVALSGVSGGFSHGLISGSRRLTALRRLFAETADPEFSQVKALVIRPETAQDAYVAMVEENEIRVNLSHYERARIAVRALQEGVYPTLRTALQGLFGNAARSKRSKIGSFTLLVDLLDDVLRFPSAISEKLGLALARRIAEDLTFAAALRARMESAASETAGAEIQLLSAAIQGAKAGVKPAADPERIQAHPAEGLHLSYSPSRRKLELSGAAVTDELAQALQDWLSQR
tara:strand:+ start:3649 stop:4665 length:1017 start_codon:yes stop_codon:yes gene_type:complete